MERSGSSNERRNSGTQQYYPSPLSTPHKSSSNGANQSSTRMPRPHSTSPTQGNSTGSRSPSSPTRKLDSLPYAVEAEISLTSAELDVLREQYAREGASVTPQTKFNFAWGLVRSKVRVDQELGVKLLYEIYKENPSRRRECLYYLALGHYKLGQYAEARKYNDSLLHSEPTNPQSKSLKRLIDDKVRTEGFVGLAVVGAAVAAAGFLFSSLLKRK